MRNFIVFFFLFVYNLTTANAQVSGCPDPAALNYDSTVTINNGSCTYNNVNLNPQLKYNLNTTVNETSGLAYWKKKIWTHNDSGGEPVLYKLNTSKGAIETVINITNAINVDWEDIAQDKNFFYIGDFGNNANGNRTDLKIYKVAKADILAGNNVTARVINFSYEDQTDFTPKGSNNTNFDCEALIAYRDSLFLFSKDWVDNKTRLYQLPKKPGTYAAKKIDELDVKGLITGAEILADKRVIVLTGYSTTLTPFVYLLYDFTGTNFFGANKRKVGLNQSFTQVEGICAMSQVKFLISNEKFQQVIINTPAKMQTLNLGSLLNPWYRKLEQPLKKIRQPVFASVKR